MKTTLKKALRIAYNILFIYLIFDGKTVAKNLRVFF